jgi:putative ABC transport system ATP-binding protein
MKSFHGNVKQYSIAYSVQYNIIPDPLISKGKQILMITVKDISMVLAAASRSVTILDRITFEIPAKQTVAIVGPSGSGKSTLLGLMAGLDRPTTGSIQLDGTDITNMGESQMARFRREKVGYIFQSFHLIPTLTAIENVAVPLELSGVSRADDRAAELLAVVGLSDRMEHYPVQLSGGEQQRVAVARAFACRPPILLADEPTGNLDSSTGAHIIQLLLSLHRDYGTTLVLVTHDAGLASSMQRVLSLRDGRLEFDSMPASSEFLNDFSTTSPSAERPPSADPLSSDSFPIFGS